MLTISKLLEKWNIQMLLPRNKLFFLKKGSPVFVTMLQFSQTLSAGVSHSVHSVRQKEVLTVTKIKHPPAAQLSSTGTQSKWPLNSIIVLHCQIMGCHGLSTPDNAGPLPTNHWACYAANCSFSVLVCSWQTLSTLPFICSTPWQSAFFLNMTTLAKSNS